MCLWKGVWLVSCALGFCVTCMECPHCDRDREREREGKKERGVCSGDIELASNCWQAPTAVPTMFSHWKLYLENAFI